MNISSTHITQQEAQERALNNEKQEDRQNSCIKSLNSQSQFRREVRERTVGKVVSQELALQKYTRMLDQNPLKSFLNQQKTSFIEDFSQNYMPTSSIRNHKKKQMEYCYNCVSYEKRLQLLRIVLNDGISIYRASRTLNINNSTAKVIVRNYKKYNHIFMKKTQKKQKITHIDDIIDLNEDIKIQNFLEGQIKKQEQPIPAHQQSQPNITPLDKLNHFQPYYYVFVYDAPYFWNSWLV